MGNSTLLKGMIQGMESMGAKFVKNDQFHFYFDIKKGSEIDDHEKLKKAKEIFMNQFNMGIKVKRVS